jgi:glycosyltransferase involved in cell wall biosynthesis
MNVPIFYKGKFVVTVHDLLMQKHRGSAATTLPFFAYFPKLAAAKLVFRHAVSAAEKIIVPSYAVKGEVVNFYHVDSNKITVTYEGVNPTSPVRLRSGLRRAIDRPYFIYVGNAYPHKNLERAIAAAAAKKILFVIVSSRGVFTEKLEEDIKKSKAGKYVKLFGFVPDNELKTLLKNSLGFVYPSLSEGFGLPGLEAMSAGTLVLASDIPVFKEVYKNVPIYFDPYDVDSIKKAIEKVVKMNLDERNKLIEEGKKLVKMYSWSKMAEETLKIYEGSYRLRSG